MSNASDKILGGLRVCDVAGEPAAMTGRILADLGAEVVRVEPSAGDRLRFTPPFLGDRRDAQASLRFAAWSAGKRSVVLAAGSSELCDLLRGSDVVLETQGWPGTPDVDLTAAPPKPG